MFCSQMMESTLVFSSQQIGTVFDNHVLKFDSAGNLLPLLSKVYMGLGVEK